MKKATILTVLMFTFINIKSYSQNTYCDPVFNFPNNPTEPII